MSVTGFTTTNFLLRAVSNDYNVPGTALTIHAWIYLNATGNNDRIAGRFGASATLRDYLLALNATGQLVGAVADGSGQDVVTGATVVPATVWRPVALRKNGTGAAALQVWLNGATDGSATSNRSMRNEIGDTGGQFRIGLGSDSNFPLNGRIAEVALWNAALSNNELVALAKGANPVTIRPANLRGYFPLWTVVSGVQAPQLGGSDGNLAINGALSGAGHAPVSAPPPVLALAGRAA